MSSGTSNDLAGKTETTPSPTTFLTIRLTAGGPASCSAAAGDLARNILVGVTEQFENDGSLSATIIKSMKRAMAGEYSRELSAKVFTGQCRLITLGFRQGGTPGYGLRRQLIDEQSRPKAILANGEHKSLQTDRVVLVAGPEEEVRTVRRMYQLFIERNMPERQIASILNTEGLVTDLGRPWTRGTVHQVLTNEKYVGHNVYNRMSFKLKKKRVRNVPDSWIRSDDAFEAIVDQAIFDVARQIISERSRRFTDAEMLEGLKHRALEAGTKAPVQLIFWRMARIGNHTRNSRSSGALSR